MKRHAAPDLPFLPAAGRPRPRQPKQLLRVTASKQGMHLLQVLPLHQSPAPPAPPAAPAPASAPAKPAAAKPAAAKPAASSSSTAKPAAAAAAAASTSLCSPTAAAAAATAAAAAAAAAYGARLKPLSAMLLPPDQPSELLRVAAAGQADAATHAALLLAATYDAVQGHQRPPPPDDQLGGPVCRCAAALYEGLLAGGGVQAGEKLRHACTKAALLAHPPGWWEVETQPGQPPRLVTPCLPWRNAALAWPGYSSSQRKGGRRYLTLDLGSLEAGAAAAAQAVREQELAADRAAAGYQLRRGDRLRKGEAQGQRQASAASGGAGEGREEGRGEARGERAAGVGAGEGEGEAEEEQGKAQAKPTPCRVLEVAHRLVGLVMWGQAPINPQTGKRMELLHVCNNPRCLNPAHLVWGTHKENMGASAAAFQPALVRCGHHVAAA